MIERKYVFLVAAAIGFLPLLGSCDKPDIAVDRPKVPEGMVEVRPTLPETFCAIPRDASEVQGAATRVYDDNAKTDGKLGKTIRLPEGSTVWLIAENTDETAGDYVKKSYVVYNPDDDQKMSYLVPCSVDDEGNMIDMDGAPLYLKDGVTYRFYAVSPARKIDETKFIDEGQVAFQVKNGEYFYANDCRYASTTPKAVLVESSNTEPVQEIKLSPMINQTAELKFRIGKGEGVHNLDIQPSGIQISGLQNDSPDSEMPDGTVNPYGTPEGLFWHMSQSTTDEPIDLQHGDKSGTYTSYDYRIDLDGYVNIDVPILPMWGVSKSVIVVFRLKVNGVPSSYEMMLNEKDFKAGYSYGYRGEVSISEGVSVITWQYVAWDYDVEFPFD